MNRNDYRRYELVEKHYAEETDPATIELLYDVAVDYIYLKLRENGKLR